MKFFPIQFTKMFVIYFWVAEFKITVVLAENQNLGRFNIRENLNMGEGPGLLGAYLNRTG